MASPSANRRQAGLENMYGNFVNMLPLRGCLTGNPTFKEHVKAVRSTLLAAMEHSDIPFPKLVEALDIPQTPSYTPVFQALVSLADEPLTAATKDAAEGLRLHALPTMVSTSRDENTAKGHTCLPRFVYDCIAFKHGPAGSFPAEPRLQLVSLAFGPA